MRTTQLALPAPPPPARYGLIVDEVLLNAVGGGGRHWWAVYAARLESQGLGRVLAATLAGAVVEYGPWSRDDAEFAQQHLVANGVHPKVLKVRAWVPELPACTRAGRCRRCGRSHRVAASLTGAA